MSNGISGLGSLPPMGGLPGAERGSGSPDGSFSGMLTDALQQVNQLNNHADQQIGTLLQGRQGDMSSVMIAVEKADVAFQLMMQVRNKIVNAYQEIEKMQF